MKHGIERTEWEKKESKDEMPNGIPFVNSILGESALISFFTLFERGNVKVMMLNTEIQYPHHAVYPGTVLMLKRLCDAIKMAAKMIRIAICHREFMLL